MIEAKNQLSKSHLESILKKIASQLINNDLDDVSILTGNMGLAIFFFHYARYSQNSYFKNIALNLVGNVFKKAPQISCLGLNEGLMGVYLGCEYLKKNEFLNLNTNLLFSDLDGFIFDYSFRQGISIQENPNFFDEGLYYLARYNCCQDISLKVSLYHLLDQLEEILRKRNKLNVELTNSIIYFIDRMIEEFGIIKPLDFDHVLNKMIDDSIKIYHDKPDRIFLLALIEKLRNTLQNTTNSDNILDLVLQKVQLKKNESVIAVYNTINDCCKVALHKIIYDHKPPSDYFREVIIDLVKITQFENEIELDGMLNCLNKGISAGISGVGLAILFFLENGQFNHY